MSVLRVSCGATRQDPLTADGLSGAHNVHPGCGDLLSS